MVTIVLAGGGSAGHVEPALAVARQWRSKHLNDKIVFLGTTTGLETKLVPEAGFTLSLIPRVRISRRPTFAWLKIPFVLIKSIKSSYGIIKNASVLIGFGGYVSAPAYIAAKLASVPIVIHEANAKPGLSNRLGARLSKNLAVAHQINSGSFKNASFVGLPLRKDVMQAFANAQEDWQDARKRAKVRLNLDIEMPLILVLGGSQGSVAINNVIEECVDFFNEMNISVLHSVGKLNQLPASIGLYKPINYLENMADAYLAADLLIGRSGAVTCSEFRALGRYALFIPLPIGNGEQLLNASDLVNKQRAQVISQSEFTFDWIKANILQLLIDSKNAPVAGDGVDVDSAEKIATLVETALNT